MLQTTGQGQRHKRRGWSKCRLALAAPCKSGRRKPPLAAQCRCTLGRWLGWVLPLRLMMSWGPRLVTSPASRCRWQLQEPHTFGAANRQPACPWALRTPGESLAPLQGLHRLQVQGLGWRCLPRAPRKSWAAALAQRRSQASKPPCRVSRQERHRSLAAAPGQRRLQEPGLAPQPGRRTSLAAALVLHR